MKTEKANNLVFIKTANKSAIGFATALWAIAHKDAVKLIHKIGRKVNTPCERLRASFSSCLSNNENRKSKFVTFAKSISVARVQ